MNRIPNHLWRDVLDQTPALHVQVQKQSVLIKKWQIKQIKPRSRPYLLPWIHANSILFFAVLSQKPGEAKSKRLRVFLNKEHLSLQRLTSTKKPYSRAVLLCLHSAAWASQHGCISMLQFLKDYGIDPTFIQPEIAALRAVEYDQLESLKFLKESAWLNKTQDSGPPRPDWTNSYMMGVAVKTGNVAICQFLWDWGLTHDVAAKDDAGKALSTISKQGNMSMLHLVQSWIGQTMAAIVFVHAARENKLLVKSAKHGHVDMLQFFKTRMPSFIISQNSGGIQAVNEAAQNGHVNTVKFLFDWHLTLVPLESLLFSLFTYGTLSCAATHGHQDVCQFLKDMGMTSGGRYSCGRETMSDIFQDVCAHGHAHILHFFKDWILEESKGSGDQANKTLLQMALDADVNSAYVAAKNNHVPVLQFLKDLGLTQNDLRCPGGNDALRAACTHGHLEVCRHLKDVWGLTLDDVLAEGRHEPHLSASSFLSAIKHRQTHILQFLRDWRDPGSDRQLSLKDINVPMSKKLWHFASGIFNSE